jgi:hypothetical protein
LFSIAADLLGFVSTEAGELLDRIRQLVEETDRLRWRLAYVVKRDAQALQSASAGGSTAGQKRALQREAPSDAHLWRVAG